MSLPEIALPTDTVTIAGQEIPIRSLSRQEAIDLQKYQTDADEGEVYMIACATGLDMDEVRAWRKATPTMAVQPLMEAIVSLSGLDDEDPKGSSGS